MGIEITRWDAADDLIGTEAILAYLEAVFEDGENSDCHYLIPTRPWSPKVSSRRLI
ncbi:MAG: hypothetical protein QOH47_3343 [Sphingomonadales bacterium]|jgi:DNA-binding phage protein|nr:hypothetical protein [Sphingomonadales bacterium]